jgi:hypothetical protein
MGIYIAALVIGATGLALFVGFLPWWLRGRLRSERGGAGTFAQLVAARPFRLVWLVTTLAFSVVCVIAAAKIVS